MIGLTLIDVHQAHSVRIMPPLTTIEEAVQHIEAVCAFIELPVYLNNPEEIQAG